MPRSHSPARRYRLSGARPGWLKGLPLSLAAAVLALPGCGNLTAGGFGEAHVVVSGDAPDAAPLTTPAAQLLALSPSFTDHEDDDDFSPEGEIELEFRLYLERDDGASYPLSDQDLEIELDLEGDIEIDAVRTRIPTGTYRHLRIVFLEIEVEVDAGVVIDGVPVSGLIDIELEAPGLDVRRAIDITVRDGDVVELLLDLNAAVWLRAVDPTTLTVSPAAFAEAFSVVRR